jgi:hypothetical protein
VKANLIVSGNSILNDATTAVSTLNVSGNTSINGTLTLNGSVTAISTLNVASSSTLMGAVTSGSTLNVSGNTIIGGSLTVNGNTILSGWNVKNIVAGSNITVQNNSGNYTISSGGGVSNSTLGFDVPTFSITSLGNAINGTQTNEFFGQKVCISSDGNVIAIGLSNTGIAKIYAWNGTEWIQRGATFS